MKKTTRTGVGVDDDLIRRAIDAAHDDDGKVGGGKLHQTMRRLDPGFDFKSSGHSSFSSYVAASSIAMVTHPNGPGDIVVGLATATSNNRDTPSSPSNWGDLVDTVWSVRAKTKGGRIAGPTAAIDAAKAIGISNIKRSHYKSLKGLIEASELLGSRWKQDGNAVERI